MEFQGPGLLLIVLVVVALAFDFLNGLHDAANSIATIVSTRVLAAKWAVLWAAFFNFVAFLFFGLHVATTVGKGIIDPVDDIRAYFSACHVHANVTLLRDGSQLEATARRALATKPRLLFLDEVMAGLAGGEVEVLMDVVERVADSGTTVLMIEHLVGVILALTDRVLVLDFGRELFQGAPEDVVAHPEVIDSYLGKPLDQSQMVR